MLPILPQADESSAPVRPAGAVSVHELLMGFLLVYCVAGAVSGGVDGVVAWGMAKAFNQWAHPDGLKIGPLEGFVRGANIAFVPEVDFPETVARGVACGVSCGALLFTFTLLWAALRHPVRAAALCAALGGSLAIVVLASGMTQFQPTEPRNLLVIPAVMLLGAIFGFLTTLPAWLIERRLRRLERM